MVAIYTAARPGHQAIALAISHDHGRTFERFAGNPVLDVGSADFRDPKVFRHGDRWVMAVAWAVERRIAFFASDDLIGWRHLSDFSSDALPDGHWECPDLFELDGRWVLIVSVFPGSAWYFLGDFDGTRFVAESCERLDHGTDFYAPVTFNDAPARVMIGVDEPLGARGERRRPDEHAARPVAARRAAVAGARRPAGDRPRAARG